MTTASRSLIARSQAPGGSVADKNTPFWREAAHVKPLQPLPKTLDVAIVGTGYAGLSAGLVLAPGAGRSVTAFDAMSLGESASSRTVGITSGTIRLDDGYNQQALWRTQSDGYRC